MDTGTHNIPLNTGKSFEEIGSDLTELLKEWDKNGYIIIAVHIRSPDNQSTIEVYPKNQKTHK